VQIQHLNSIPRKNLREFRSNLREKLLFKIKWWCDSFWKNITNKCECFDILFHFFFH